MFSKKISAFSIFLVLLLTACASIVDQPEVDWKNGASRAWIISSYSATSPGTDFPQCLDALSNADLTNKHFVKIEYRRVRQMLTTVAELPEALDVKANDQVEVWLEDCTKGKISRISRLLPSVPSQ
ncbi:MAG TPA: hypothetical protein VIF82_09880 [Burkholderiaceae bacterium]|jgi:malate synthase